MLYAIYLRKSRATLKQKPWDGETLARHRAALLDYAAHHGLEIGAVYEEIISRRKHDAQSENEAASAGGGAGALGGGTLHGYRPPGKRKQR